MKVITKNLLRLALVTVFLTTVGASLAQAQVFGFGSRFPDCSGNGTFPGQVLVAIGLTAAPNQRLICIRLDDPGNAYTLGTVSGFTGGDTRLVGMDFRSSFSGQYGLGNFNSLYGVGNNGGIYVVNQQTGALNLVNRVSVALSGTSFGVDFNPAADRLRIISDTGQNLRQDVDPGGATTVDAPLNYAMVTATGVTGAAYTNNDNNPGTGTTLYDIDSNLDTLVIQNPPNAGTLTTVGALGVNTTVQVGFDIFTNTDRFGVASANRGFASLTTGGTSTLYFIDLGTGAAINLGAFSAPNNSIEDIALPLRQEFSPVLIF